MEGALTVRKYCFGANYSYLSNDRERTPPDGIGCGACGTMDSRCIDFYAKGRFGWRSHHQRQLPTIQSMYVTLTGMAVYALR